MPEIKLSNACNQYGASMGRRGTVPRHRMEITDRLSLTRVRLNAGGYDNGGAYWGSRRPGESLWLLMSPLNAEEYVEHYFDAPSDRGAAIARARELGYVNARIRG